MRSRPSISFFRSFQVAWRGFAEAVAEQRNLRIHLVISVLVVAAAAWLQISWIESALLAICMGNVVAIELINTGVETIVDLVSPDEHELARKAKDISAAAVLLVSIMAAAVGTMILGPPLLQLLH